MNNTDYGTPYYSKHKELERDVEKKLIAKVAYLGGTAYKFVSPQRRSVPDRLVVMPGGRIYFVEVKREGEVPTKTQRREIDRLKALGCEVHVVAGMEEVETFCKEILK